MSNVLNANSGACTGKQTRQIEWSERARRSKKEKRRNNVETKIKETSKDKHYAPCTFRQKDTFCGTSMNAHFIERIPRGEGTRYPEKIIERKETRQNIKTTKKRKTKRNETKQVPIDRFKQTAAKRRRGNMPYLQMLGAVLQVPNTACLIGSSLFLKIYITGPLTRN